MLVVAGLLGGDRLGGAVQVGETVPLLTGVLEEPRAGKSVSSHLT